MYCYNCGGKVKKNHKFCSHCGNKLDFGFLKENIDNTVSSLSQNLPDTINNDDNFELEREINFKKERLSELIAEINELKLILMKFEYKYNKVISVLYIKLDKINLEIKKNKEKINLIKEKQFIDEDEISDTVDEKFKEEKEKIKDDEERINRERIEFENLNTPEVDEQTDKEIRKLYKELVKTHIIHEFL